MQKDKERERDGISFYVFFALSAVNAVGVKPQRTQGTQKILSVGVLPSSTYKILAITCDPPVQQCKGSEIARSFVFLCVLGDLCVRHLNVRRSVLVSHFPNCLRVF